MNKIFLKFDSMENYATEFGYQGIRCPLLNENVIMDVVPSYTFMTIMILFITIMIPYHHTGHFVSTFVWLWLFKLLFSQYPCISIYNSSPPSAVYMRQWIGSTIQIMACRVFGAKIWTHDGILLIEPLGTKLREILIEIYIFPFKKMHLKLSSAKWQTFVSA